MPEFWGHVQAPLRRGYVSPEFRQYTPRPRILGTCTSAASARLRIPRIPLSETIQRFLRAFADCRVCAFVEDGLHSVAGQRLILLGQAPRDRAILMEVAESYRLLNQPQRALQTLQTLAETYSPGEEPGRVLYLLGTAQLAVGRPDDAAASLSAAIARENPTVEMYYQLAEAQYMSGHPSEAAAAVQQALAMQPSHGPSRELLQRIELARHPRDSAVR